MPIATNFVLMPRISSPREAEELVLELAASTDAVIDAEAPPWDEWHRGKIGKRKVAEELARIYRRHFEGVLGVLGVPFGGDDDAFWLRVGESSVSEQIEQAAEQGLPMPKREPSKKQKKKKGRGAARR